MSSYQSFRKPLLKLSLSILLVLIMTYSLFPSTIMAVDATGTWKADIETQVGVFKYTYILKQEGTQVTGKILFEMDSEKSETAVLEGKVNGDIIEFVEMMKFQGMELKVTYKGKVTGDEISFTRQVGEYGTEEFIAKRGAAQETKK
jgi:D-glucosaminate-6-phosphate ammonia-lyase